MEETNVAYDFVRSFSQQMSPVLAYIKQVRDEGKLSIEACSDFAKAVYIFTRRALAEEFVRPLISEFPEHKDVLLNACKIAVQEDVVKRESNQ